MKRKYSTFHGLTLYFMGLSANGVNRWTKTIKRAREGEKPPAPYSSKNHDESRERAKTQKLIILDFGWGGVVFCLLCQKSIFFSSGDKLREMSSFSLALGGEKQGQEQIEWVTNGLCEHSRGREHCDFLASTSRDKKFALRAAWIIERQSLIIHASSDQFREYNSRAASTSYISACSKPYGNPFL